jgi:tetratricopeptide (TPR) repeat protein
VLWIEDLHWAEPALLDLVDYVLQPREGAPIFGIGTARPEFTEAAPAFSSGAENRRVFDLEALDEEAAVEMIVRLLGEGDVNAAALRQLLDAAGGNPLFLEEMIQSWVDAGGSSFESIDVPSSLNALIGSRLDHLPPAERRVLGRAAVVGEVFWTGALEALEAGNGSLPAALASLEERDLVRSRDGTTLTGQREFAFKHGLIRDVAYARLPKGDRAVLHERCGTWIAAVGEDEFVEIIAYHLEEACKLTAELARSTHAAPILAAVKALTRAAEKSQAREGNREAARFYDRAVGLVGDRYPETLTDLKFRRARLDYVLGQIERALADFAEVAKAAVEVGRLDIRCGALVNLAEASLALGRASEAEHYLEEAETAAEQANDSRHRIRNAMFRAMLRAAVEGKTEEALRELHGAVELAEEIGDRRLTITSEIHLGVLGFNAGRLADAERAFRRVIALANEQGSVQDEAMATGFLAAALYHVGPRAEAEETALKAEQWLERLNDKHQQSQAIRLRGKLALERDEPAEAQQRFIEALEILPPHKLLVAGLQRLIAEARARQGRAIGARAAAAAAQEAASDEEPYAMAFAAVAGGCAGTAEADEDAAREGFELGISLFEKQGMMTDLAEARATFARAHSRFGHRDAAGEQLKLARDIFDPMGAAASVESVERLSEKNTEGADIFGPLG